MQEFVMNPAIKWLEDNFKLNGRTFSVGCARYMFELKDDHVCTDIDDPEYCHWVEMDHATTQWPYMPTSEEAVRRLHTHGFGEAERYQRFVEHVEDNSVVWNSIGK